MINPLEHRIIFATPRRLARVSAWREHIPFGMFLVGLLRPRVLVELGTHWGNSYCAFCQAVDELQLPTKCYAVDTWTGDAHAGEYGPDVLSDLRAHHDPLYGHFSRLVQSTFDDACRQFDEGTVDFLHLDGFHTYESVRHDFETWLPKLSDRAVVLIHDINARERDFGAWKLWEEARRDHRHLELLHAHGLGILAVGDRQPDEFVALLDAPPEVLSVLREFFFQQGYLLRLQLLLAEVRAKGLTRHEALTRTKAALTQQQELVTETTAELAELRTMPVVRMLMRVQGLFGRLKPGVSHRSAVAREQAR